MGKVKGAATRQSVGYGRRPPPTRLQRTSLVLSYLGVLSWATVVIAIVIEAAVGPGPGDGRRPGTPVSPARPEVLAPPVDARAIRLEIPAVGVDASLRAATLNADPALSHPRPGAAPPLAGWYRVTPVNGTRGGTLIIGHVDSHRRSAVGTRIRRLRAGDLTRVVRDDGTTLSFRIDSVERMPADRFPTARAYGATASPGIRLIVRGDRPVRRRERHADTVIAYGRLSKG